MTRDTAVPSKKSAKGSTTGRPVVRNRMTQAPPSRAGKRLISAFVDPIVLKEFRLLVIANDSTIQETLVQLINEYFVKHGKPPIAR